MKRFIEGVERHQVMLLPDCLDNYIDDEITEDIAEHLYFDSVPNFFCSRLFGLTPGLREGSAPAPVAFRS